MSESFDVIVCGSGPAGLSAALESVRNGKHTLLLEKMVRPACKLYATGGGRCNFSNTLDPVKFMNAFGRSGRFMSEALKFAPREWVFNQLRDNGIEPILEDDMHYFPSTGHASDVIAAFLHPARALGLELLCSAEVSDILSEDGAVTGMRLKTGETFHCSKFILAGGGTAFGGLGGSWAGLKLALLVKHTVVRPAPAMAPLLLEESWPGTLAGITLPNVSLTFGSGRSKTTTAGILLFTKEGVSGPAALDLSGPLYRELQDKGEVRLSLSFDAAKSASDWKSRLENMRKDDPKKFTRSSLAAFFTHSTANAVCENTIGLDVRNAALSNPVIEKLAAFLTAAPLTVKKSCPMDKAMAMSGGVSLKEVDPKTMESRLLKGLYFAGEILDLTGPCGGFNVQFALSSGRLAGWAASRD